MKLHILRVKEAPFVLLGLVAILSWSIKHVVDRATSSPIIEYSTSTLRNSEWALIECGTSNGLKKEKWNYVKVVSIANLSSTTIFKDTIFALRFFDTASNPEFLGVRVQVKPPAVSGKDPGICGSDFAKYSDITLYPGWEIRLVAATSVDIDPVLHLIKSNKIAVIKKKGLQTFLVKNETHIFIFIITLLIFILGIYIWSFSMHVVGDDKEENGNDA